MNMNDSRPEFFHQSPGVFGRNENQRITEENVETAFDLMMFDWTGTVQQSIERIDQHFERE